jgi:hypothetical protein
MRAARVRELMSGAGRNVRGSKGARPQSRGTEEGTMYQMSKEFLTCNVAGQSHWDIAEVFDELKVGSKLKLKAEPDNPYDSRAVAVYFHKTKIGFVPRACNGTISQLLAFGHSDVFKAYVLAIDPTADLEHRVTMRVNVTDARE